MGSVHLPDTFHYTKQDGLYQLRCGGAVLADMSRVAVAFAIVQDGTTVRHKHGTPESVLEWFQWAKSRYEAAGLAWVADELCYLVSDRWDLGDLNRIMEDEGYIATFLQKVGIDPTDLKVGPHVDRGCSGGSSCEEVSSFPV